MYERLRAAALLVWFLLHRCMIYTEHNRVKNKLNNTALFISYHPSRTSKISTNIHNLQQFHNVEFPNDNEPKISGLVSPFATAICAFRILRCRGMDLSSITYLLFTKLRRWKAMRQATQRHTIHESAHPTCRVNNASVTRYDDIFALRGPQTRRHLAHRDRITKRGHVEYITAT